LNFSWDGRGVQQLALLSLLHHDLHATTPQFARSGPVRRSLQQQFMRNVLGGETNIQAGTSDEGSKTNSPGRLKFYPAVKCMPLPGVKHEEYQKHWTLHPGPTDVATKPSLQWSWTYADEVTNFSLICARCVRDCSSNLVRSAYSAQGVCVCDCSSILSAVQCHYWSTAQGVCAIGGDWSAWHGEWLPKSISVQWLMLWHLGKQNGL
jgi:hypothetical protein